MQSFKRIRYLTLLLLLWIGIVACSLRQEQLSATSADQDTPSQATDAAPLTQPVTSTSNTGVLSATLVTKEALNIRSGPGLQYPVIGNFAGGAISVISGRSVDNLWWQIQCQGFDKTFSKFHAMRQNKE